MSYATFQQHLDIRGQETVLNALKGSAVLKQSLVEDANEAASADIDSAGEEGGFDTPFDPIALSTDPVVQVRIEAWLRLKTVVLAWSRFLQVLDDTEKMKTARAECEVMLDRLRQGKGFPVAPPLRSQASISLISQPGASDRLTQETLRDLERILV